MASVHETVPVRTNARIASDPDIPATSAAVQQLLERARTALAGEFGALELVGLGRQGLVLGGVPVTGTHPVAIKVDFGATMDPFAHQRFEAECRIGQRLTHPAIIPVSPLHSIDGLSYFVMPYVGEGRLDLLLRFGPPPRARALAILRSIASALDYAHSEGIVHGALRASKIHLPRSGGCLVSGFMLSMHDDPPHPHLAPSVLSDPVYLAPDQREEGAPIDGRLDQYALAVIASELLFGARPVIRRTSGVSELTPPGHQDRPPDVEDANAIAAIRRALLPDPHLRFATASQFVEALTRSSAPDAALMLPDLPGPRWHATLLRRVLFLVAVIGALWLAVSFGHEAWRWISGSGVVPSGLRQPAPR